MNEPSKIPAASINGIDLKRIAVNSQSAADEIMRIGLLLDEGADTTTDLITLCELLDRYGESEKAEELLRCNIVEKGDACYEAYRRLYGYAADHSFDRCMAGFSTRFGVRLTLQRQPGFLKQEYT